MTKRVFNLTLKLLIMLLTAVIVIIVTYLLYVMLQYSRIPDDQRITTVNPQEAFVRTNTPYTITTYNVGFGAYNQDFSFFMDSGVMKDGTAVAGKYAKAFSQDVVLENIAGASNIITTLQPDFALFQEVDKGANRSYKVDMVKYLSDNLDDYSASYASNFHSAFLYYPFNDPIGKSESGIVTFSKYKVNESIRKSFTVDNSFPERFFDLDRCFMISRFQTASERELVIINVHLSAYDEGGIIRKAQLEQLNIVLTAESAKGNYVVVGGDYNHDIASSINSFETKQIVPEWVHILSEEDLPTGYSFASSNQNPTCRSTDLPYQKGVNYTVVLDGFIISDNIEKISVENIITSNGKDVNFMYSDHNPVLLTFLLKTE